MPRQILIVLLAASAGACAFDIESGDIESGEFEQPIVGGDTSVGFPGVVLIGGRCTGTLITPSIVLTAAHCEIRTGDRANIMSIDTVESSHRVTAVHHHRLYNDAGGVASADVTVALLENEPPVAPFAYPVGPLDGLPASQITSVGFGHNVPDSAGGFGTKREAVFNVDYVNEEILQGEGAEGESVCSGDSGGPAFQDRDGAITIVGIARSVGSGCRDDSTWTRVDAYAAGFIVPAIDSFEGPCKFDGACVESGCRTPDPDCAPCGLDGVCSPGCSPIDLDCPPKNGFNAACGVDDDCESLVCVTRDSGGSFCSRRCSDTEPCPDQNACESRPEGDVCVPRALDIDDGGGCGCESGTGSPASWLLMLLVLGVGVIRRRARQAR